jgi:cephalosporin-C deacetylase-like acetyl esterase
VSGCVEHAVGDAAGACRQDLETLDAVDSARIGIWGTSFSGGTAAPKHPCPPVIWPRG